MTITMNMTIMMIITMAMMLMIIVMMMTITTATKTMTTMTMTMIISWILSLGEPVPSMQWFKGGKPLKMKDHYKMVTEDTTCTFTINKAEEADSAEYKCSATNTAGSVDATFTVTVKGKRDIS